MAVLRGILIAAMLTLPGITGARETPRRQLPPPRPRPVPHESGGNCTDPLQGVWTARRYDFALTRWVEMTMVIMRDTPDGDGLHGRITSRDWSGPLTSPDAICQRPGQYEFGWDQPARGVVEGARVTFEGTAVRMTEHRCGLSNGDYALDRLTGVLGARDGVIWALNNDGRYEINAAYQFHRVRCL